MAGRCAPVQALDLAPLLCVDAAHFGIARHSAETRGRRKESETDQKRRRLIRKESETDQKRDRLRMKKVSVSPIIGKKIKKNFGLFGKEQDNDIQSRTLNPKP
jgi:hypothetical protein